MWRHFSARWPLFTVAFFFLHHFLSSFVGHRRPFWLSRNPSANGFLDRCMTHCQFPLPIFRFAVFKLFKLSSVWFPFSSLAYANASNRELNLLLSKIGFGIDSKWFFHSLSAEKKKDWGKKSTFFRRYRIIIFQRRVLSYQIIGQYRQS